MNDNPRRQRQRKGRPSTDEGDEPGEPQLFRSVVFRTVTWIVLILLAISTIALLVMALRPPA